MINDIIEAATTLVNTPGVVMMGVGLVSAMVLKSLVTEVNKSSPTLISYRTESNEFPLPIPQSIYYDESKSEESPKAKKTAPKCTGVQDHNRKGSPSTVEQRCFKPVVVVGGRVDEPIVAPCKVSVFDGKERCQESKTGASSPRREAPFPDRQWKELPEETAFHLSEPTNPDGEPPYFSLSDPAAGDSCLIVESPDDWPESEMQTSHSRTNGNSYDSGTHSSFTGPFLAPMNVMDIADDSTSQSVTWTEAYVEREPFSHELKEKADDKKIHRGKPKNHKC